MAIFEDPFQAELELEETTPSQEPEAVVEEVAAVVDNPVPEKYQGKSVEDIVKMHQEAEKLIGKQAQEVGEVRKLADELLKRQLDEKKATEPTVVEEDLNERYIDDPLGAVNAAVDRHPAIEEARRQSQSMKEQQVTQRLAKQFPNYGEVTQDPKFFEWVKASPIRTRLFTEAHSQFDYDSAAELLSTWDALNPAVQETSSPEFVAESRKGTKESLRAASVDTGTSAPTSRKTYRRTDLINLRLRDPSRYEAMQDDILAAYAEGRVK